MVPGPLAPNNDLARRVSPSLTPLFVGGPIGSASVVGEDVPHARYRLGEEDPPLVHSLAEARDLEPAVELPDRAVVDVGHEEPRRVRAAVDGRDADHLRTSTAR